MVTNQITERMKKLWGWKDTIVCSRCGCKRLVPDNYQYKKCPKCHRDAEKEREKAKVEKKERQDKEVEQQIRMGNWNYDPSFKPEPFISYEDYKRYFPDASLKTYMKEKEQHNRTRVKAVAKMAPQIQKLYDVPLNPKRRNDCLEIRKMYLGYIRRDAIAIQNHCACKWCGYWLLVHKKDSLVGVPSGVDMWHPERNRRRRHSEEDCQAILNEEFSDYTD